MNNGSLDIVCGFMIIDENSRTIVLEGICGPSSSLGHVFRRLGRAGSNGDAYRVLENPRVRFAQRLYTCFNGDLKKVMNRLVSQNPQARPDDERSLRAVKLSRGEQSPLQECLRAETHIVAKVVPLAWTRTAQARGRHLI